MQASEDHYAYYEAELRRIQQRATASASMLARLAPPRSTAPSEQPQTGRPAAMRRPAPSVLPSSRLPHSMHAVGDTVAAASPPSPASSSSSSSSTVVSENANRKHHKMKKNPNTIPPVQGVATAAAVERRKERRAERGEPKNSTGRRPRRSQSPAHNSLERSKEVLAVMGALHRRQAHLEAAEQYAWRRHNNGMREWLAWNGAAAPPPPDPPVPSPQTPSSGAVGASPLRHRSPPVPLKQTQCDSGCSTFTSSSSHRSGRTTTSSVITSATTTTTTSVLSRVSSSLASAEATLQALQCQLGALKQQQQQPPKRRGVRKRSPAYAHQHDSGAANAPKNRVHDRAGGMVKALPSTRGSSPRDRPPPPSQGSRAVSLTRAAAHMTSHAVDLHHLQQLEREAMHRREAQLRDEVVAALRSTHQHWSDALHHQRAAQEKALQDELQQWRERTQRAAAVLSQDSVVRVAELEALRERVQATTSQVSSQLGDRSHLTQNEKEGVSASGTPVVHQEETVPSTCQNSGSSCHDGRHRPREAAADSLKSSAASSSVLLDATLFSGESGPLHTRTSDCDRRGTAHRQRAGPTRSSPASRSLVVRDSVKKWKHEGGAKHPYPHHRACHHHHHHRHHHRRVYIALTPSSSSHSRRSSCSCCGCHHTCSSPKSRRRRPTSRCVDRSDTPLAGLKSCSPAARGKSAATSAFPSATPRTPSSRHGSPHGDDASVPPPRGERVAEAVPLSHSARRQSPPYRVMEEEGEATAGDDGEGLLRAANTRRSAADRQRGDRSRHRRTASTTRYHTTTSILVPRASRVRASTSPVARRRRVRYGFTVTPVSHCRPPFLPSGPKPCSGGSRVGWCAPQDPPTFCAAVLAPAPVSATNTSRTAQCLPLSRCSASATHHVGGLLNTASRLNRLRPRAFYERHPHPLVVGGVCSPTRSRRRMEEDEDGGGEATPRGLRHLVATPQAHAYAAVQEETNYCEALYHQVQRVSHCAPRSPSLEAPFCRRPGSSGQSSRCRRRHSTGQWRSNRDEGLDEALAPERNGGESRGPHEPEREWRACRSSSRTVTEKGGGAPRSDAAVFFCPPERHEEEEPPSHHPPPHRMRERENVPDGGVKEAQGTRRGRTRRLDGENQRWERKAALRALLDEDIVSLLDSVPSDEGGDGRGVTDGKTCQQSAECHSKAQDYARDDRSDAVTQRPLSQWRPGQTRQQTSEGGPLAAREGSRRATTTTKKKEKRQKQRQRRTSGGGRADAFHISPPRSTDSRRRQSTRGELLRETCRTEREGFFALLDEDFEGWGRREADRDSSSSSSSSSSSFTTTTTLRKGVGVMPGAVASTMRLADEEEGGRGRGRHSDSVFPPECSTKEGRGKPRQTPHCGGGTPTIGSVAEPVFVLTAVGQTRSDTSYPSSRLALASASPPQSSSDASRCDASPSHPSTPLPAWQRWLVPPLSSRGRSVAATKSPASTGPPPPTTLTTTSSSSGPPLIRALSVGVTEEGTATHSHPATTTSSSSRRGGGGGRRGRRVSSGSGSHSVKSAEEMSREDPSSAATSSSSHSAARKGAHASFSSSSAAVQRRPTEKGADRDEAYTSLPTSLTTPSSGSGLSIPSSS